jgi:hypothetical protein
VFSSEMTRSSVVVALLALLSVQLVSGQNGRFYYRNFRDRSYLALNGDAQRDRDCVKLTYVRSAGHCCCCLPQWTLIQSLLCMNSVRAQTTLAACGTNAPWSWMQTQAS